MHAWRRRAQVTLACLTLFVSGVARAQTRWNDSATMAMVRRAIAQHANPTGTGPADSGLTGYHAVAHGYVNFLGQVGPGFPEPPKIVRSDELVLDVYWHTPKLTRELIIGHRDTLLLPLEIDYYNDRYGIFTNDLGDAILVGDGHDVRNVPHPVGAGADTIYDYTTTDSVHLRTPTGAYDLYEVRFKPKNPDAPRAVGTVYIERASGAIARMSLTFTEAAILDKRIDRLTVTLENALIDGRYWLPKHQSLEVSRTSTWLDYPMRGIIRSQWDVCCYELNPQANPAILTFPIGPRIFSQPPAALARYPWTGHVLDSMAPDVEAVNSADVRQAEEVAQQLLQAAAVTRRRGTSLAAHSLSDFARINRVEGLALGAGISRSLAAAWSASIRARYGISDHAAKGDASVAFHPARLWTFRAFGYRTYRDVGDVQETSTLVNSLASELFGADRTDPYDARGGGVSAQFGAPDAVQWHGTFQREAQDPLHIHASPLLGFFGAPLPAWSLWDSRASTGLQTPLARISGGLSWRASFDLTADWFHRRDSSLSEPNPLAGRAFATLDLIESLGHDRLIARTTAAGVTANGGLANTPPQDFVFLGGPTSAPGYGYHEFADRAGVTEHLEWQFPIPAPAIPFWHYGNLTRSVTVSPYLHTIYVTQPAPFSESQQQGWLPSAGLGLTGIFNLVRLDIAHGFQRGRWTFSIDAAREFWGVL